MGSSASKPEAREDNVTKRKTKELNRVNSNTKYYFFKDGGFSLWANCGFHFEGMYFNSVGQYMMYCKADMFNDRRTGAHILNSKGHYDVTRFGRHVKNFDADEWNDSKTDILWAGNYLKFSGNQELRWRLFDTFPLDIAFADPDDDIFGTGLPIGHPNLHSKADWPGSNILGLILTDVRDCLMLKKGMVQPIRRKYQPTVIKILYNMTLEELGFKTKQQPDKSTNNHNEHSQTSTAKEQVNNEISEKVTTIQPLATHAEQSKTADAQTNLEKILSNDEIESNTNVKNVKRSKETTEDTCHPLKEDKSVKVEVQKSKTDILYLNVQGKMQDMRYPADQTHKQTECSSKKSHDNIPLQTYVAHIDAKTDFDNTDNKKKETNKVKDTTQAKEKTKVNDAKEMIKTTEMDYLTKDNGSNEVKTPTEETVANTTKHAGIAKTISKPNIGAPTMQVMYEAEPAQSGWSDDEVEVPSKQTNKHPSAQGHDSIGDRQEYVFFWKEDDIYSQWYPSSLTVDGQKFSCAEQHMMFKKAELFDDKPLVLSIMETTDPWIMKFYGRRVKNLNVKIWQECCIDIVRTGNMAKFSQNKHLQEALIKTHPKILVEASPYDKTWGIGLSENNPKAKDAKSWNGLNLLGYVITDVREELMRIPLSERLVDLKAIQQQFVHMSRTSYEENGDETATKESF